MADVNLTYLLLTAVSYVGQVASSSSLESWVCDVGCLLPVTRAMILVDMVDPRKEEGVRPCDG